MHPLVSIILPVYNGAQTVRRAVGSVQEQTLTDWELVCVDDGSSDGSGEILRRFSASDQKIRLSQQSHSGADPARNAGFIATRAPIITFLDADDWYEPDHLAAHLEYINAHPEAEVVISRASVLGDPYVPDVNDLSRLVHLNDCVVQGTLFIRRDIMRQLWPMPNADYGSDFLLCQKILKRGFAVHHISLQTYVYDRRAPRSLTKEIARRFSSQLVPQDE